MKNKHLLTITLTGLLAALTCAATMLVRVPSATGYKNLGDCVVLLSGWLLGPIWGFLAGGIGSGLADLLAGYGYYVPGTFIIKGATSLVFALLYASLKKKMNPHLSFIIAAAVGESVMVAGYFGYSFIFLGKGIGAAASVPGNVVQGLIGIAAAFLILLGLAKIKDIDKIKKS
ncbi:MAG: ECF transporter S component [Clostridia bacterium]|nr:ECF transporter S component [Clostridia bacterium]